MSAESTSPIADCASDSVENDAVVVGSAWLAEHVGWLQRLIERRVSPLDCGDEVLQEVLLAASRSTNLPEQPSEQQPWLARVAIRQSALALRTWCRRRRREAEYAASKSMAEDRLSSDPIYWLMTCERRDTVRQQLTKLEPRLRDLLIMKYVKGLTYKDIASCLNMDVSAVEYRLSEARKTLRLRLLEAGFDEGRDNE